MAATIYSGIVCTLSCALFGARGVFDAQEILGRTFHLLGPQRNERHEVDDADSRVDTLVSPEVDELGGSRDAGDERIGERALLPGEREHRAVVVRVGVHVQEGRARAEGLSDRRDDRHLASFRDVGHRFQHDPYPTNR